jgi:amino-acid N-acetyltransferase
VIAPARADDRAAVIALLRACALPVEDLAPALERFFVARDGDAIVGCIGLDVLGPSALLRSVAVLPAWRGRGLARRLWEQARQAAGEAGIRELFLLTATAEAIFARWGFTRIGRDEAPDVLRGTAEFRALCPASAVVMRLSLEG